jgi:hypothetical protein
MSKFHTCAYSFTALPTVPPTLNYLRRPSVVATLAPSPPAVQTLPPPATESAPLGVAPRGATTGPPCTGRLDSVAPLVGSTRRPTLRLDLIGLYLHRATSRRLHQPPLAGLHRATSPAAPRRPPPSDLTSHRPSSPTTEGFFSSLL